MGVLQVPLQLLTLVGYEEIPPFTTPGLAIISSDRPGCLTEHILIIIIVITQWAGGGGGGASEGGEGSGGGGGGGGGGGSGERSEGGTEVLQPGRDEVPGVVTRLTETHTAVVNLQVARHPGTGGGGEHRGPRPHRARRLPGTDPVQHRLGGPVQAVAEGAGGGGRGADVGGEAAVVGSDDLDDLRVRTVESDQLSLTPVLALQASPL